MTDNIIELEESFDPSAKVYVRVVRKDVTSVYLSNHWHDAYELQGAFETVKTDVVSHGRSIKVLQELDRMLSIKGSITDSDLREKYSSLAMEVLEAL